MRGKLEIRKGGKLIETYWDYDEEKQDGEYKEKDVTDQAIRLFYECCELEDGITLRDVFLLLNTEIDIFDAVIGNWCKEIATEGLRPPNTPIGESEIEYLELNWHLCKDKEYETKIETLNGYIFPEFHGIGFEHKEDEKDEWGNVMCLAGERITWGISFSAANELAPLPLKLKDEVRIYNEDDWKEKPQTFEKGEYSLGHILYGIIWELSFNGDPASRDKKMEDMNKAVEEVRDGTVKLYSDEEIWGDTSFLDDVED